MDKRGFTLVEMLIGLMFLSTLTTLVIGILNVMQYVSIKETSQITIFQRQFQQFINRNHLKTCTKELLTFNEFEVLYHNARLVKRPGYEILLENVTEGSFRCSPLTLMFSIEGEAHELSFKIP